MKHPHRNQFKRVPLLMLALAPIGCNSDDDGDVLVPRAGVTGAGYTTEDKDRLGCLDSPNGIDCNHYDGKDAVYMNGGPTAGGVGDGQYYFAVIVPGYQNGGFLDGADGNLSDTTAGATAGDSGSGDDVSNRTFTVANHEIDTYTGTHAVGESLQGRKILQLIPYDDTSNPGGVYIMAICRVGAVSPSECKFDAFKVTEGEGPMVVSR